MADQDRELLENPSIALRIFRPCPSAVARPFMVQCDGASLACHLHRAEDSKFTVVYFHGNGELVSNYEATLPPIFEAFGCSTLLAEYRGYGGSTGEPSLINLIEDVIPIVDALGERPERLIFYGRSFGSLPAIHASSLFPDAHGLILESGIADVGTRVKSDWLLDNTYVSEERFAEAIARYFDHKAKLSKFRGFTAVTHCAFDRNVPVRNAHTLHGWANDPKSIDIFPRGDHNSIFADNIPGYIQIFERISAHSRDRIGTTERA